MIKKAENAVRWTYVMEGVNGKEITRTFYENNHDTVDFVKKADFDDKLKSLSKKVALIKKHVVL